MGEAIGIDGGQITEKTDEMSQATLQRVDAVVRELVTTIKPEAFDLWQSMVSEPLSVCAASQSTISGQLVQFLQSSGLKVTDGPDRFKTPTKNHQPTANAPSGSPLSDFKRAQIGAFEEQHATGNCFTPLEETNQGLKKQAWQDDGHTEQNDGKSDGSGGLGSKQGKSSSMPIYESHALRNAMFVCSALLVLFLGVLAVHKKSGVVTRLWCTLKQWLAKKHRG